MWILIFSVTGLQSKTHKKLLLIVKMPHQILHVSCLSTSRFKQFSCVCFKEWLSGAGGVTKKSKYKCSQLFIKTFSMTEWVLMLCFTCQPYRDHLSHVNWFCRHYRQRTCANNCQDKDSPEYMLPIIRNRTFSVHNISNRSTSVKDLKIFRGSWLPMSSSVL